MRQSSNQSQPSLSGLILSVSLASFAAGQEERGPDTAPPTQGPVISFGSDATLPAVPKTSETGQAAQDEPTQDNTYPAELIPFQQVTRIDYQERVRRAAIFATQDKLEYIYCFDPIDRSERSPYVTAGLLPESDRLKRIDDNLTQRGFVIVETPYALLLSETSLQAKDEPQQSARTYSSPSAIITIVSKVLGYVIALAVFATSRAVIVRSRRRRADNLEKARQQKESANTAHGDSVTSDLQPCRYSITTSMQPTLTITLAPHQRIITERGALLRRANQIESSTASGKTLGLTGTAGAIGRSVLSGESLVYQVFRNNSQTDLPLVLGPSLVGQFLSFDLSEHPNGITARSGAFFAATPGIKMQIDGSSGWKGMFSGTGIFRQRFSGAGHLFLFSSGDLECVEINQGDTTVADTDAVFAWEAGVTVELKRQSLADTALTGEGLVVAHISGQGRVWYTTRGGSDEASSNKSAGLLTAIIKTITDWQ